MRPSSLRVAAEASRSAAAAPVRTLVVFAAVALMCLSVFLTTGRTAAAERQILDGIEQAGARLVVMAYRSTEGGIDPAAVARINGLNSVEWAIGFGPAFDTFNAAIPGGTRVGTKLYVGDFPDAVIGCQIGRQPGPGQAAVTAEAAARLGLVDPSGSLRASSRTAGMADDIPVVGQIVVDDALADIQSFTLVNAGPQGTELATIYALATSTSLVGDLARAMVNLSGVESPTDVAVTTSSALVDLHAVVTGEFGTYARLIGLAVLGAGMLFVGLTLFISVATRRRDFGRRRALGATRSLLVALVLLEAAIPAVLGAIGGTALGLATTLFLTHTSPEPGFTAAVAVLATLAALTAATPAAVTAALRDPLTTLRTP